MPKSGSGKQGEVDRLLEEILTDAYGEDEQLWAFRQAFEDSVRLPAKAEVLGQTVTVEEVDYDGNPLRGLTARCRDSAGKTHRVALADVTFVEEAEATLHLRAYLKWLGADSAPARESGPRRRTRKQTPPALDLTRPIDLVVLSVKERGARCRLLNDDRVITLTDLPALGRDKFLDK